MRDSPLIGPPPAEVPLPNAPLIRVIAQVRFPLVASVERRDFVAPFQESLREEYAILRQDSVRNLLLLPGQPTAEVRSSSVWRFHDLDRRWRVTLAADFLSLETDRYTSRADFFGRFDRLLSALEAYVKPGALDRLGVRYIDRLTGEALERLPRLVRPALLGALGTPLMDHASLSVSEGVFDLPEESSELRARWGLVPAHETVDPNAIVAVDEPSWVLDLDAFQQGERAFDGQQVAGQARALAERIYAFFRWSVTGDFLRHFGGDL
ncbi:MAG: TIGR04255 family protein [Alphaproteobacteria bacterium]|nr:TIGR04255 family protein [Alphaproteobacteria bacterium]